ncbi:MAG TPA: hypothetical protein VEW48_21975 [Thermoanaerobaculia bacterium]|nr:hypothetical protein [Thermoanaerobaculia bacterium]
MFNSLVRPWQVRREPTRNEKAHGCAALWRIREAARRGPAAQARFTTHMAELFERLTGSLAGFIATPAPETGPADRYDMIDTPLC